MATSTLVGTSGGPFTADCNRQLRLSRNLWLRGEQLAAVSTTALIGLLRSPVHWSRTGGCVIPLGVSLLTATQLGGRYPLLPALTESALFMVARSGGRQEATTKEFNWGFFQVLAGNSYLWLSIRAAVLLAVGRRREKVLAATVIQLDAVT
ncbi:hypothetical protein [Kribbella sp. NPDC051620]|uniref:hypothetical protein n=1 Tax=Kribbella sp. NPDC051620 TaxID=3364120 RepID=UPI00379F628F